MNAREETLYRRALRLNRYVQSRWRRETTAAERERTVHAHAVARRIRRDAARLSAARAIDRLEHALEQLEADHPAREHVAIGLHALTGCDPPPTAYEAYATGESRRPARLRALASIASALDHADDMPAGARVDIEAARVALIAQERRAIPIETVGRRPCRGRGRVPRRAAP